MKINSIKFYLILSNIILVIFAIWFSNVGLLPFTDFGDFLFFALLSLIFAIYRPGWAFVLFIGALTLENINLAPQNFGLTLRPYQFLGAFIIVALFVRILIKKLSFVLPQWKWYDALPIIFVLAGFVSTLVAISKGTSFKQSLIAMSFAALYFLTRVYIQSLSDLKRIAPFFLSSAFVVALYGIWQNIIFMRKGNAFEIMPGRPNGTFAEPDWFGVYLLFLMAVIYVLLFYFNKKKDNFNLDAQTHSSKLLIFNQYSIFKFLNFKNILQITISGLLVIVFISLILTVSRSAWIGAIIVTLVFLKIVLTGGSRRISDWNWKNFFRTLQNLTVSMIFSLGIIYVFHLTNFQLFNRATSINGLQKITISCKRGSLAFEQIANIEELNQYGCKHINLEDIDKEKELGNEIREILRSDPNINIRSQIYQKSWQQIKQHPILGIGWGSIGAILGNDERGTGLNASNIFLEVWLSTGLMGFLAFIILIGYVFVKSALIYLDKSIENKTATVFIILGWTAIVIPNLFNAGIFLGFVWVYLAVAVGLLADKIEE